MKRIIKTIGTILTIATTTISVFLFNGIQAKAAEPESIVNMNAVTDFEATENGLQLYFHDDSGCYWEMENANAKSTTNAYIPLDYNLVDMDTVIDFKATEYGLYLYFSDGSGYFWER